MNTANLLSSIRKHVSLSEEEAQFFTGLLTPLHVRQGEMVEKLGEPTKYFIYVVSGCLMSYYTDGEGNDHVMQFAQADWWTGDLTSYFNNVPSTMSTRALAETEVFLLPKPSMDQLLEKVTKMERYFRILFQNALMTNGNRIMQNFSVTAEERYLNFQKKYPSLEQYVPQKYIASYLGITPEFLSKIRRKLTQK